MSETHVESLTADSTGNANETSSTSNHLDDEARRKKILSKMWGKGNKSSHKVRELEKCSASNGIEASSTTNEENSNSINMNKPFAVVKPIMLVKSDLVGEHSTDDTYLNATPTTTVSEPTSSSNNNSSRSEKKKTKKKSRSRSKSRSDRHSKKEASKTNHSSSSRHRHSRRSSSKETTSQPTRSKAKPSSVQNEHSSSRSQRKSDGTAGHRRPQSTKTSDANLEHRPKERIPDRRPSSNGRKSAKPRVSSHSRRSPSPYKSNSRHRHSTSSRSRYYHRSRYDSSRSSSSSVTPRRRHRSRSSSSSSRSSSSSSSFSRSSSSSRSRSRTRQQKKCRRSPTLEKLFLKASESIESVSTQKNPHAGSASTHVVPLPPSSSTSDFFVGNSFAGFSAPPPPFQPAPPQRFLKEIAAHRSPPPPSTKAPRTSRFSDAVAPAPPSADMPVETDLNYLQIVENINCLPAARRQQKRHNREVIECDCSTSEDERARGVKACGSECLNRMLLIECGPLCPCGQWCTNRRFQRRSYAEHKLVLFKTEQKGIGIRTTGLIRKGRFLVEYVGEVIEMDELARRSKKYKRDGLIHQYVMSLIHGTVIDSTVKGNWARFINHSCEPNCAAEKWLVNGEYRMGFFAKRELNAGEELTIDYRFETFGTGESTNEKCFCGAPTCRGTISLKSNDTTRKRAARRSTLDDDELLVYLRDETTNEFLVPKTIDEIRQLIQIMSRTDSENIRSVELDLIKHGAQKQTELPRLFLECNGLHVLSAWVKDILIDNEQNQAEQQYSKQFQFDLLDFIHQTLPIKDRTTVVKHGLFELIQNKIQLPKSENDDETIKELLDSMLNHLDDPIITKLFQLDARWSSLKERFIIPKRKESQTSSEHHHHHHHHSSKHLPEETSARYSYNSRSSTSYSKSTERSAGRRALSIRDLPRSHEQQLSKDERRRLFEQQYEDEERARAAGLTLTQNEPPLKKQRTSDGGETSTTNISPQSQDLSKMHPQSIDHMYWMHQQLSQIPLEYIRTYLTSMDPSPSALTESSSSKEETTVPPPPAQPDNDVESARIIRLPAGWAVTMCPADSAVYFYNRETLASSWTPPATGPEPTAAVPLALSPLSSAHVIDHHHQHRPHPSSARVAAMKLSKHPHRHNRLHRHHHHHHHHHLSGSSNATTKRKRVSAPESNSTTTIKEESQPPATDDPPLTMTADETTGATEMDHRQSTLRSDEVSTSGSNVPTNDHREAETATTVKNSSEGNMTNGEKSSFEHQPTSSSSKANRDLLRKHISQHVHTTLKPYTKRTCKQGRIVATDDIKYLVKKFTLAVLDKEIEKAKNEGIALSPVLTDRVRLKTEVYVRKYMQKMGPVFHRHDPTVTHSSSSNPSQATPTAIPPAASSSSSTIVAETNDNSMNAE